MSTWEPLKGGDICQVEKGSSIRKLSKNQRVTIVGVEKDFEEGKVQVKVILRRAGSPSPLVFYANNPDDLCSETIALKDWRKKPPVVLRRLERK